VITLRGSGEWDYMLGNAEGIYFLGQWVEGDAQITVRLLTLPTRVGGEEGVGLTIRETLDAGARHASLGTGGLGPGFVWRTAPNGANSASATSFKPPPVVLRLTRKGDTITADYSADDGKTFRTGRPFLFSPPLAKGIYLGLFITANDRSQISEAKFSGLEIRKL
jgi:hypothetical protein